MRDAEPDPVELADPDEYTLTTGAIANGLASGLDAQALIGAMCFAQNGADLDAVISVQITIKEITEAQNARRQG